MALYKIPASRVNNIEASEYVGGTNELGRIWYDEVTGALRLYTGFPGGRIINSNGTPGGSNTQIQFNNNGEFAGSTELTFDSSTGILTTGSISTTGNIAGNYFIGNGALLTGISSGASDKIINGSSNVQVYPNGPVTVTVNDLANVAVFTESQAQFNSVQSAGNVTTGEYFIGDGSKLTGITAQGLPTQNGNAGLFLSTDGSNVLWNGPLASSLTFSGGLSGSNEFGNDLDGGDAAENFVGATNILCGDANSNYNLTLSSVALTGQAEDVIISSPPLLANSVGSTGQFAFDFQWLYICVSNNNWKRAALNDW
jgi:hypothetical protein